MKHARYPTVSSSLLRRHRVFFGTTSSSTSSGRNVMSALGLGGGAPGRSLNSLLSPPSPTGAPPPSSRTPSRCTPRPRAEGHVHATRSHTLQRLRHRLGRVLLRVRVVRHGVGRLSRSARGSAGLEPSFGSERVGIVQFLASRAGGTDSRIVVPSGKSYPPTTTSSAQHRPTMYAGGSRRIVSNTVASTYGMRATSAADGRLTSGSGPSVDAARDFGDVRVLSEERSTTTEESRTSPAQPP